MARSLITNQCKTNKNCDQNPRRQHETVTRCSLEFWPEVLGYVQHSVLGTQGHQSERGLGTDTKLLYFRVIIIFYVTCGNFSKWHFLMRATSHTGLRACDHYTSSTLIGGKGGAGPLDTFFWALTISWSWLWARVWSGPKYYHPNLLLVWYIPHPNIYVMKHCLNWLIFGCILLSEWQYVQHCRSISSICFLTGSDKQCEVYI